MDALDVKVAGFEKFNSVQDILDQNKILINEINSNHEARTPEALARNVLLIRELNNNVNKVVEMYGELSDSMESFVSEGGANQTPAGPPQSVHIVPQQPQAQPQVPMPQG